MPATFGVHRRPIARIGLLLAALLHLLGAAGEVWIHAQLAVPVAHEQVVLTSGADEHHGAPVHSDRTCAVCQLFGAHAIPGTAPVLRASGTRLTHLARPRATLHEVAFPLTARPRAPPPV